ncbi:MAG: hypothetical protein IPK53_19530 [bacterium]|nr:hypothetical protein [bacterium]
MECYHGVISLDHTLDGAGEWMGRRWSLAAGAATSKRWGQSFPQAWVWLQSNRFHQPGVCLTGSIAIIPWRRGVTGLLAGAVSGRKSLPFLLPPTTGLKWPNWPSPTTPCRWVLRDKSYRFLFWRGAAQTQPVQPAQKAPRRWRWASGWRDADSDGRGGTA